MSRPCYSLGHTPRLAWHQALVFGCSMAHVCLCAPGHGASTSRAARRSLNQWAGFPGHSELGLVELQGCRPRATHRPHRRRHHRRRPQSQSGWSTTDFERARLASRRPGCSRVAVCGWTPTAHPTTEMTEALVMQASWRPPARVTVASAQLVVCRGCSVALWCRFLAARREPPRSPQPPDARSLRGGAAPSR